MPVSRRSRLAAVAAAVALIPLLGACSSVGFGAPTGKVYQPAVGADNRSGSVDVLNAFVVSGTDGSGTLVATFVDNRQDTADSLVSVSGENLTVDPANGVIPATIPVGGHLNLADLPPLGISGAKVAPGNFITLTFEFAVGEPVTITIPVVPHDGMFADIQLPSPPEALQSATSGTQ